MAPFAIDPDGEILTYADLQPNGYMDHVFVRATANGQGMGRRLMARIHVRVDELGITELTSRK